MHLNKDFIRGGISVILLEIIIGSIITVLVYINYENITKNESISEDPVQKSDIDLTTDINNYSIKKDSNKLIYKGTFGEVQVGNIQTGSNIFNFRNKEIEIINLNYEDIKYHLILNNLIENGMIDIYMYNYFSKNGIKSLNYFLHDAKIMSKYLSTFELPVINNDIVKDELDKIRILIENKEYEKLVTLFKKLENSIIEYSKDDKYKKKKFHTTFSNDQEFNYIISKLYGENSTYKEYIDDGANEFNYNKNLLIASIATEQMRGFYTDRGQIKNVLQKANLLLINNKFSFGIGGVKLETATNIEKEMKEYNQNLYSKYFGSITKDRHYLLTQTNDYQVYYPAILVYNILKRWKNAGFDISHNPGVVVTLYNFGNPKDKFPHENPEIGGAVLDINGTKYTFGGLGMLVYYILEFYN